MEMAQFFHNRCNRGLVKSWGGGQSSIESMGTQRS